MTTQTSSLLTIPDAAEVMGTDPIAVQRLIARRRLGATRMGVDGEYRVRAADADQYVATGAPDFDPPKIQSMDDDPSSPVWFDTPSWPARQLTDALGQAAAPGRLSDQEYLRRATASGGATIFVDVPLSAEMQSLLSGPAEAVAPLAPGMEAYRAKSAADYWLADKLQSAALSQIDVRPKAKSDGRTPIQVLYESPETYRQIVDAAVSTVSQLAFFSVSEFRNPPATTRGPGDNQSVQISYRSKVSAYANAQSIRRVADSLAF